MSDVSPEAVHREALGWFEANWDDQLTLGDWWDRLAQSGWGFPGWPAAWFGKGLRGDAARAAIAARNEVGAFGPAGGVGAFLAAPTILHYGTESQKQQFLPGIANGRDVWCQLFSEPGAGSDMASLSTKAVRDGDEWVVTGQKVWNSGAQYSKWAILIARTDPTVPKHRGMSFFLFDMEQPGVEVRPLREMTGDLAFNEVFLTEARVPDANRLGDLGDGWRVAMTTLSHERDPGNPGQTGGGGSFIGKPDLTMTVREYIAEQARNVDGFSAAIAGGISATLQDLLDRFGYADDPVRRQRLMQRRLLAETSRLTSKRASAAVKAGGQPGPEISTLKLAGSELGRRTRDIGFEAMGPYATLQHDDAPTSGLFHNYALFTPAMSIAGGSDEVQRNIIGERVLGLPKEPDPSKDLPFNEVRGGGTPS